MAGKKYRAALEQVDSAKVYDYKEAIALAKKISTTKFDSSVEASFVLNVDPRQAEQNIRGAMVLPNGTGKTQRVLVITQGAKEDEAKAAGADFVGGADMIQQIQGGWFDFDIIVATPDMMGQLGKLGKVLGPKGLMPNPKTGTVTFDVAKAVKEAKSGKVEYRTDKQNIVHVAVGKASFGEKELTENIVTLLRAVIKDKPASAKGRYLRSVTLASTMGPGIKLNGAKLMEA